MGMAVHSIYSHLRLCGGTMNDSFSWMKLGNGKLRPPLLGSRTQTAQLVSALPSVYESNHSIHQRYIHRGIFCFPARLRHCQQVLQEVRVKNFSHSQSLCLSLLDNLRQRYVIFLPQNDCFNIIFASSRPGTGLFSFGCLPSTFSHLSGTLFGSPLPLHTVHSETHELASFL